MNPTVRQILVGIVFFVAGLSLGWMAGAVKTYKETAGIVAEADFKTAAAGLSSHISLLQLLHARDYPAVAGKLEELVDTELATLARYPAPLIPSEDKVIQSIVMAKQYRDKHPVTGRDTETAGAIERAFGKTVTKGEP